MGVGGGFIMACMIYCAHFDQCVDRDIAVSNHIVTGLSPPSFSGQQTFRIDISAEPWRADVAGVTARLIRRPRLLSRPRRMYRASNSGLRPGAAGIGFAHFAWGSIGIAA